MMNNKRKIRINQMMIKLLMESM